MNMLHNGQAKYKPTVKLKKLIKRVVINYKSLILCIYALHYKVRNPDKREYGKVRKSFSATSCKAKP